MNQIVSIFLDLLYPSNIYCINCGKPIYADQPYSLCSICVRSLHWANISTCEKCGKPMEHHSGHNPREVIGIMKANVCSDCRGETRSFEKGFTCVSYGLAEKSLIHRLKYRDMSYLADQLAELMYEKIAGENLHFDFVVPVPMYKSKERRRGYNQAALLSKRVSERLNVPHYPHLLVRKKNTAPMSGLGTSERRENVQDVFIAAEWVQGNICDKSILLVDDVFTTGSTVNACSAALTEAGAGQVHVLTFAAGGDVG